MPDLTRSAIRRSAAAVVEQLEGRRLLAVTTFVSGNTLFIGQTEPLDTDLRLIQTNDGGVTVQFGNTTSVPNANITNINVGLNDGNDRVRVIHQDSNRVFDLPVTVRGGGGNDTIQTGAGNDEYVDEAGDDFFDGGAGDDLIEATFRTEFADQNTLIGGNGNDTITSQTRGDSIEGGAGNDVIRARGASTLFGGDGDDRLFGFDPRIMQLLGNGGNDYIRVDVAADFSYPANGFSPEGYSILQGQQGDDTLVGSAGREDFSGGTGNDTVELRGRPVTTGVISLDGVGNDGPEGDNVRGDLEEIVTNDTPFTTPVAFIENGVLRVLGTDSADNIGVSGQNDQVQSDTTVTINGSRALVIPQQASTRVEILGFGGDDTLFGQVGFANDITVYGVSAKVLFIDGGAGEDDVSGEGQYGSEIRGGIGNDQVGARVGATGYGDEGNDQMRAIGSYVFGARLFGGTGNDTFDDGGFDNESSFAFHGEEGDDIITARGASVQIFGGPGNDVINAADDTGAYGGTSSVDGGEGNDTISFSTDKFNASVFGGAGDDVITTEIRLFGQLVVDGGDGNDRITTTAQYSGAAKDLAQTITGGGGNDTLFSGIGSDDFSGGPGTDTVDYSQRPSGNYLVSFDNIANDGAPNLLPGNPDGDPESDNIRADVENVIGATIVGSGTTNLFTEPFDEPNGATTGNLTPIGTWRTYQPNGGVAVDRGSLLVQNTNGFASWYTSPLDISGKGPVDIAIDYQSFAGGTNDFVRFLYRVDNGPLQEFGFRKGQGGPFVATAVGITGNSLKIEVQFLANESSFELTDVAVNASAVTPGGPSVEVVDGVIRVRGTDAAETIETVGGSTTQQIRINGEVVGEFDANLPFDIDGGGGNDTLLGGFGTTGTLAGGAGNDTIRGTAESAFGRSSPMTLLGGAGDDDIFISVENNGGMVDGGAGNDRISASGYQGSTILRGSEGNDTIGVGGSATSHDVDGGAGDDNLSVSSSGTIAVLKGGIGNDTLTAGAETNATLLGGDGNDSISASDSIGEINGGAGEDTIIANRSGVVRGGAGNDTITHSTSTFSEIFGDDGDDLIDMRGNSGANVIDAGAGNDTIYTSFAGVPNTVLGGAGNDTLIGSSSADDFSGGAGTDTVVYRGRTDGPFSVTFDNLANDGAAGEGDNIRSDVENALGVATSTPTELALETFDEPNGATSGSFIARATGQPVNWRTSNGSANFSVHNGVFRVRPSGGFASWFTPAIPTGGAANYSVSVDLTVSPDARGFVYLQGGNTLLLTSKIETFAGTQTLKADGLTGDFPLEFAFNLTAGEVTFDNIRIFVPGTGTNPDEVQFIRGDGGNLQIIGTDGRDNIRVENGTGPSTTRFLVDEVEVAQFTGVNRLNFDLRGGDDRLEILDGGPALGTTINAGSGDDTIILPEGFHNVDLGDGNDTVRTTIGTATINGGAGNDTLISGPSSDVFNGGTGVDTVDYDGRSGATVSFDGVANDGITGENDNIASDVENIVGATVDGGERRNVASETFNEPNGSTSGNLANAAGNNTIPWATFQGGTGGGFFAVDNGKLRATNTAGAVSWYTQNIPINETSELSAATRVEIDLTATGVGPDDLARFLYRIDNGPATQFAFYRNQNGNFTAVADGLVGQTLRLEVQLQAKQGTLTLDNVRVSKALKDTAPAGIVESFDNPDGATSGRFGTGGVGRQWNTFRGGPNFSVQNRMFRATDTGGFRTWYTNAFDIGTTTDTLSIDFNTFGTLSNADRLNVVYRIDGGPAQQIGSFRGGVNQTLRVTDLPAGRFQLEIQANVTTTSGGYTWDNIRLTSS